jgi:hypothetical protein
MWPSIDVSGRKALPGISVCLASQSLGREDHDVVDRHHEGLRIMKLSTKVCIESKPSARWRP